MNEILYFVSGFALCFMLLLIFGVMRRGKGCYYRKNEYFGINEETRSQFKGQSPKFEELDETYVPDLSGWNLGQ